MRNPLSRRFLCDIEERRALMRTALGQEPADIAIVNASMVNVYTGELQENCAVAIKGKWIAAVGPDAQPTIGESTLVLDASGKILIPGFIEGHTHLAWIAGVEAFLPYAIKGGTTTIITETLEAYPVAGNEGVCDFLDSLKDQPIKFLGAAPAMVSVSRASNGIAPADLDELLKREDVVGLGESYWQGVLQSPDIYMPLFQKTLDCGKVLEGHTAGAKGKKLMAYVASGASSCHEPIKAQEALERLRLGLYVMAREGSIRKDLEAIAEIRNENIDFRRLILVTDGVEPKELIEKGYLEFVVQKAIDLGFDPIKAIQMATLNVAEHFGLDDAIGGLAPGKCADILMIPDLKTISPKTVISNGRIIFKEGKLLEAPRKHNYSHNTLNSIHLPRAVRPSDFDIRVRDASKSPVKVRVIEMVTDLVTKETLVEVAPVDGKILMDLEQDILKIAAVDRRTNTGKTFVGLIKGFQMKKGAMAASSSWDTYDIVVVGANEEDMALAVNRIHELQGGIVICAGGKVKAELPLPVFGIVSDLPMEEISERLQSVRQASSDLGMPFPDSTLSLITLTGAAIPHMRICEEGIVNMRDGKTHPLEA